jgi:hypothetical protein
MRRVIIALGASLVLALSAVQPAAAHVGRFPHAQRNWDPRPDCVKYKKVNGPISSGWRFNAVVREYNRKVRPLPPMRGIHKSCPAGSDAIADVQVDEVFGPRDYCSKYAADFGGGTQERILLAHTCNHKRESACAAVGFSVGQHPYRRTRDGVRKGCAWRGAGPRHVSPREDFVLSRAW